MLRPVLVCLFLLSCIARAAQTNYTIQPVIGSGLRGDGGAASGALLDGPLGLARDGSGNIYISESNAGLIRRVRPDGVIERYAGTGVLADGIQNQPALSTDLIAPGALLISTNNVLFFADNLACRVRKVQSDGTIMDVIGTGRCSGQSQASAGGPIFGGGVYDAAPLETDLGYVSGLAFDSSGRLLYADQTNHVVRRLDTDGIVRTIAGNGVAAFYGDDGAATDAYLSSPAGVTVDRDGKIYIADGDNCRIRVIDSAGDISTFLSLGSCSAPPARVSGINYDSATHSLLVTSSGLREAMRIDIATTTLTVLLGNGKVAASTTTQALSYSLAEPRGIVASGDIVLVADNTAYHVLAVQSGTVHSFAGVWPQLDTYPAPLATAMVRPGGLCLTPSGSLIAIDAGAERVLALSASGEIAAFAGVRYPSGFTGGMEGPAVNAQIALPRRVACASDGRVYLSHDTHIRMVDTQSQIHTYIDYVRVPVTTTVNGTTTTSTVVSAINAPHGMVFDSAGRLVFSESGSHRVIRYDPVAQSTTLIAGNGNEGFRGDGGQATNARLSSPGDLAYDSQGRLLIADRGNGRIRRVALDGTIQTVAGSSRGFSYSDISGQLATDIGLGTIAGLAVDAQDNLYVAEPTRISKIGADGRIQPIGGFLAESDDGVKTYVGQPLEDCDGLTVDSRGRVYASVRHGARVMVLRPPGDLGAPPVISSGGVVSASAFGGAASAAPGSWIEIYGANLSSTARSWTTFDFVGSQAPITLDGVTVAIAGQAAFLSYVSPTQINAQVPSSVAPGVQQLTVTTGAGISSSFAFNIVARQPGVFALTASGKTYAGGVLPDGVTFAIPAGAISGIASRPAQAGEYLTFYGVGFGAVSPRSDAGLIVQQLNTLDTSVTIQFGGVAGVVAYAGLSPGFVGLYQFSVTVPAGVTGDAVPLTFTQGGVPILQTLYTSVAP